MQYTMDEEMRNTRYHDILRYDIKDFVSYLGCKTLIDMIKKDRKQEIELEIQTKRKPEQVQSVSGPPKRPNTFDLRSRIQQGRGRCAKCRRSHEGSFLDKGGSCFNYGQTGHYSRDCTWGPIICFYCNQTGHKKTDCQRLSDGATKAPTTATLKITDVR